MNKKYLLLATLLFTVSCEGESQTPSESSNSSLFSDTESGSNRWYTDFGYDSSLAISSKDILPGTYEEFLSNIGDTVFFNTNSSSLDKRAHGQISDIVSWLNDNNISKITIEGHCDERGTRKYNIALGVKRADIVRSIMIEQGAKFEIDIVSYGKESPKVIGSTEEAWKYNRRAVIVF